MGSGLHPTGAKALPDEPQTARGAMRRRPAWLNRNVAGMSLTSFFSDAGHEMVTAVLPGFLGVIGVPPGALGWIEGGSDAASSFVKPAAGWYSDRIGRRKGIVTAGYFLTGTALILQPGAHGPEQSRIARRLLQVLPIADWIFGEELESCLRRLWDAAKSEIEQEIARRMALPEQDRMLDFALRVLLHVQQ